jgi:1-acyl-sn-glycerol-3-phosphate acyltransferase
MKLIKNTFWFLWRIWFHIMLALPLVIMGPIMFLFLLKEKWYPYFFVLARIWAKVGLFGTGFYYKIDREQKFEANKSYMLIANHTSMTDIMLMLAVSNQPFVFVGKIELAKIPLFGFFYKRSCILVDRSNSRSRMEVFEQAQKRLRQGLSICIFPEGGVPSDESIVLADFKDGAFRLAIEHQIPIVPITFPDNKKRMSYTFFSGSMGIMRAKVHPFINTTGMTIENKNDIREIKTQSWNRIHKQLLEYNG